MSKQKYYLFRGVQMVFTLWIVMTAIFLLFRLMPGSYVDVVVYQGADPETAAALEERWGLNDPLYIQYFQFFYNYLTLDPGMSFQSRQPVLDYALPRVFNSIILVAPGILAAYVAGSILGVVAGTNAGSRFDDWAMLPIVFIGSIPSFFTAIVLILIFASWLGWFPTSGMGMVGHANVLSWDFAHHYVLPFTAIFLRFLWYPSLIMRTSVVEVMGQPFIKYHRISGVPANRIKRNISKHASLPVLTILPISMINAIGGLILIEMVFNWPGIGYSLIQAVFDRDFPLLQFIFVVLAIYIIVANFVVDILYTKIDPRVELD